MLKEEAAKLIARRREEFETCLEIHRMSMGKSQWEGVATAVGQSFLRITDHDIESQPRVPLPPK